MATESKKLRTVLEEDNLFCPTPCRQRSTFDIESVKAFRHDARIAHEQLESMRNLVDAAKAALDRCSALYHTDQQTGETYALPISEAITAAAPFLED